MDTWIGLAGALAGTALGWILSFLSQRAQRRFEDSSRWLSDKRKIYADFIIGSDHLYELLRLEAGGKWTPKALDGVIERRLVQHANAREVALVGSPEVVAAIAPIQVNLDAATDLTLAPPLRNIIDQTWKDLDLAWAKASNDFDRAARADLHIAPASTGYLVLLTSTLRKRIVPRPD